MKNVLLIVLICILTACQDKGPGTVRNSVEIVNKIGKEYNLTYEKKVLDDGTKWYQALLAENLADSLEAKIMTSIVKELKMFPVKTVENQFEETEKYSYLMNTYVWRTPKMKLEMRYTQDMTKTVKSKYFITFMVSLK
jgi:hypothetical protein